MLETEMTLFHDHQFLRVNGIFQRPIVNERAPREQQTLVKKRQWGVLNDLPLDTSAFIPDGHQNCQDRWCSDH
jgi:hypothetical protein